MNLEWKQKCIEALRSGKYEQTTGQLRRPIEGQDGKFSYCCLGVFCDISGLGRWESDPPIIYTVGEHESGSSLVLPRAVSEFLGFSRMGEFSNRCGEFELPEATRATTRGDLSAHPQIYVDLAWLNDSGFTFNQIADMIEYFF